MARAALRWKAEELARRAHVSRTTVARFETEQGVPIPATLTVLRQTFEAAGVVFLDNEAPGVRLRLRPEASP